MQSLERDDCQDGAFSAAKALARLLGHIGVESRPAHQLPQTPRVAHEGVAVSFSFQGERSGRLTWFCEEDEAIRLVQRLVPGAPGVLDESAFSVLGEVGNIIVSSFLNALAKKFGSSFVPTPPLLSAQSTPMPQRGCLAFSEIARAGLPPFVLKVAASFDETSDAHVLSL